MPINIIIHAHNIDESGDRMTIAFKFPILNTLLYHNSIIIINNINV